MPHAEKIGFLHMIKVRSLRKFEFGIASFERQNGRRRRKPLGTVWIRWGLASVALADENADGLISPLEFPYTSQANVKLPSSFSLV